MPWEEIAKIAVAFLVGIYWIYTATYGWERYEALKPRWVTKKWQAWAIGILGMAVGINWTLIELGIPVPWLS